MGLTDSLLYSST